MKKRKRNRVPGSVRDQRTKKQDDKCLQNLIFFSERMSIFHRLDIPFDRNEYKEAIRQIGIEDEDAIKIMIDYHESERKAMRERIERSIEFFPEEYREMARSRFSEMGKMTPDELIEFSKQMILHMEGKNDFGNPAFQTEEYKNFVRNRYSVGEYNDVIFGPKNTLPTKRIRAIIEKIRAFLFTTAPEPIADSEIPLSHYEKNLAKQMSSDPEARRAFNESRKRTQRQFREEYEEPPSKNEQIADKIGANLSSVTSEKRRLKKWKLL